jgi:hypothetical protein
MTLDVLPPLLSPQLRLPQLLAQSRLVHAGDRFRPGQAQVGWQQVAEIAIAAFVVVAAAWLVARIARARQRRASQSPWRLFKDLCTAHALSNRERQLLTRLARQRTLPHPAVLFVDAAAWDMHQLGDGWTRSLPELERLRRRVFAVR